MSAAQPVVSPPPREMDAGDGFLELPDPVVVAISPYATEVEKYAARLLKEDLRRDFRADAAITSETQSATIVVGLLETFPELAGLGGSQMRKALEGIPRVGDYASEGYVIRVSGREARREGEGPSVLIAGTDGNGVLYGCLTLSQLFTKEKDRVRLPAPLSVVDYPVMKIRGNVTWISLARHAMKTTLETLDQMARTRLNTVAIPIYFVRPVQPEEGWVKGEIPEHFKWIIAEGHRRGIQVYSDMSGAIQDVLGHPLSYENPDDRAIMYVAHVSLAEMGVDGFALRFDDIDERLAPKEFGREHVQWCRMLKKIADAHGVKRFVVCPTHYWQGWQADYYVGFKEAPDLGRMSTWFCPFTKKEIAEVERAGLRNWAWWHNGTWDLHEGEISGWLGGAFRGLWSGIPRVEWGWYGDYECSPELLEELRTMPERTVETWINGDFRVFNNYAWNPARYDPEESERLVAEACWGRGGGDIYMAVMGVIREWAVKVTNTVDGTPEEFDAAMAQAREGLERLKPVIDQTERPGLWPVETRRNNWWMMDRAIRGLEENAYAPIIMWRADRSRDSVGVTIGNRRQDAQICYTLDGTEPDVSSTPYAGPLKLDRTTTIIAKAFNAKGKEKSRREATLHKHDANGFPVKCEIPYEKYTAGGERGLTDGIRGTAGFGDGRWQGFEGNDMIATVDLGEEIAIREIRAGFLQDVGPWILLPREVEFAISRDGGTFEGVGKVPNPFSAKKEGAFIHDFSVTAQDKKARFVRVHARNIGVLPEWHRSSGRECWIFVDEIMVNPAERDEAAGTTR
ncbi:MAG TPA: chitobiase/beta-hexosaminidase C-terminal domain-containing protein [Sumerlaeia bacterium]|nr:chitobiase/beta-hexosaminidase C-terminal domain-containing protein [Sumerlaeia bacterium]